jgi:hypothetical protein
MSKRHLLGAVLSIAGALIGIVGHFILFQRWYLVGMNTPSAEPGCEILLKTIHPLMADLGLLGGVLFAVSAYGFLARRNWAFFLSVVALVLALLGSWFVNVPYMAAGLPPVYFPLFWPYLVLYFLLVRVVGGVSWPRTLLALLAGMAYITCWMNGVASTSRIITIGAPIYTLVQKLHWVAMVGWAVVTVGIIVGPREWTRVVGLVAGTAELVVGIPLAVVTGGALGRFSLFALAPIFCLVLVVLFVWPGLWLKVTEPRGPAVTEPRAPVAPVPTGA